MIRSCFVRWLPLASIFILFVSCNSQKKEVGTTLFKLVEPANSSIDFENKIIEDDEFNIIEYLYFYNGGGVAVGDINNDGLLDIYFSSNQLSNRLYLNKGNFRFEDVTAKANVAGLGNWKTGVTMADVNHDGWLDIYVCGVGRYKGFTGFNQLFINNGDLTFTERAKEYGLSFQGLSTQSAFFDYDLDGDLDMYLLNHSVHSTRSYGQVSLRYQTDSLAGDRLYKNLFAESGRNFFEDVSQQAGIYSSQIGYGLGVSIGDVNRDGYPDIYGSNDFHENDYLYINQRNGKFDQQSRTSLAHSSRFSMGNAIADLNNDMWPDIITLDMLPRDESIIKTSAGEDTYEVYRFKLKFGYDKQVSRNTLQLNRGAIDSGRVVFSDIAQVAGIEATDWSWSPLATDLDGDGLKDVFITNGIVRRPNDLDYVNFISNDSAQRAGGSSWLSMVKMMPEGKVSNFVFKNNGDLTFSDKTTEWGLSLPGYSNGAAYGDLDNDGDPDLVVNQINAPALLYENQSTPGKFVTINLRADSLAGNRFAVGSKLIVDGKNGKQLYDLFPTRGFCSSSTYSFNIGKDQPDDSLLAQVIWPDGKISSIASAAANIQVSYSEGDFIQKEIAADQPLVESVDGINFKHREDDFNAFSRESLIPHMLTTLGPPLAVADVDGDGIQDVFVGGGKNQAATVYKQSKNGRFTQAQIPAFNQHAAAEDTDAAFFDADGDGDQDLVVVSGGQEEMENYELLAPRLYLNSGKGDFQYSPSAFSRIFMQASCVKPADYDGDGDVDLFIGALVMPYLYGMSPVSFLLSNTGKGEFEFDPSWMGSSVFNNPTRVRPGMVKDAAWMDVNGDTRLDLVLVGEWMPITILIQQPDHRFLNQTTTFGMDSTRGWWNTIETADFDRDGDVDFVAGNLGLNSRVKASVKKPLTMYLGDFDSNGGSDHVMVYYNGDSSYPFTSRDQLVKQIPTLKKKFLRYRDYRDVKLEDIITPMQKGNSAVMKVECLTSVFVRNDKSRLTATNLPLEAQFFPVFGVKATDVDSDGNIDILMTGNLEATQPDFGAYDAGVGLLLHGNGDGTFSSVPAWQSGFVTSGEGRNIEILKKANSAEVQYLVSRNNQSVLTFEKNPLAKTAATKK